MCCSSARSSHSGFGPKMKGGRECFARSSHARYLTAPTASCEVTWMFQRGRRRSRTSSGACISCSRRSKEREGPHGMVLQSRRCRRKAFHSILAYMMTKYTVRAHPMIPETATVVAHGAIHGALRGATCRSTCINKVGMLVPYKEDVMTQQHGRIHTQHPWQTATVALRPNSSHNMVGVLQ